MFLLQKYIFIHRSYYEELYDENISIISIFYNKLLLAKSIIKSLHILQSMYAKFELF